MLDRMAYDKGTTFFLIAAFITIGIVVGTYIYMWLWNWLAPYLFTLPTINFWQCLGLQVLLFLTFGAKYTIKK